jgi:hypothetical protein
LEGVLGNLFSSAYITPEVAIVANKIREWRFMLFIGKTPIWSVWWFGGNDRVSRPEAYVPAIANRRGLLKEERFP